MHHVRLSNVVYKHEDAVKRPCCGAEGLATVPGTSMVQWTVHLIIIATHLIGCMYMLHALG